MSQVASIMGRFYAPTNLRTLDLEGLTSSSKRIVFADTDKIYIFIYINL